MKRPRHDRLLNNTARKHVSVPFHRELRAVRTRYVRMTSALARRDPARVRVTACHLALAWLQVKMAFIRFIECSPAELGLGRKAWRERSVLRESNRMVRDWLRRAFAETCTWGLSPDESRALQAVLCWLYEFLGVCVLIGFPDLSVPHSCHLNQPQARHRARPGRSS